MIAAGETNALASWGGSVTRLPRVDAVKSLNGSRRERGSFRSKGPSRNHQHTLLGFDRRTRWFDRNWGASAALLERGNAHCG